MVCYFLCACIYVWVYSSFAPESLWVISENWRICNNVIWKQFSFAGSSHFTCTYMFVDRELFFTFFCLCLHLNLVTLTCWFTINSNINSQNWPLLNFVERRQKRQNWSKSLSGGSFRLTCIRKKIGQYYLFLLWQDLCTCTFQHLRWNGSIFLRHNSYL